MYITTQDTVVAHSSMIGDIPRGPVFRFEEEPIVSRPTNNFSRTSDVTRYNNLTDNVNDIETVNGPELSSMSIGHDVGYFFDPFDEWSGARRCAAEAFQWSTSVPDTVR